MRVRMSLPIGRNSVRATLTDGAEVAAPAADAEVNWLTAEQSNSSLIIGDAVMLKIFRRISGGPHPEVEMGRYLTRMALPIRRRCSERSSASIRTARDRRSPSRKASCAIRAMPGPGSRSSAPRARRSHGAGLGPGDAEADHFADYEALAAMIGQRLGDMHVVLARAVPTSPTFAPVHGERARRRRDGARAYATRLEAAIRRIARTQKMGSARRPGPRRDAAQEPQARSSPP